MTRWIFFAQSRPFEEAGRSWKDLGSRMPEVLWIVAAAGLVGAVVVVWALYFRKRRRHRHEHRHYPRHEGARAASTHSGPADAEHQHGHRRRRRRHHRPRNPTLAETGGLPPVRPERPPEPFP